MGEDTTTRVFSIRLDNATADFLDNLRTFEHINLSSWVREAIRAKAGLSPTKEPKHASK